MLAAIIQIIAAILGLLGQKKSKQAADAAIQPGIDRQVAVQQEQVIQDVALATKIRRDVDSGLVADPGSLRDDDGFKRPPVNGGKA